MLVPLGALAGLGMGSMCAGLLTFAWFEAGALATVLAFSLATATAVPYTAAILWVDRHEKEPVWLLSAAFLWGAVAATSVSALGNTAAALVFEAVLGDADIAWAATSILVAPVLEETTKAVALLVLFTVYRRHADNVLDGIVYGALVGLGFAWFENVSYYVGQAEQGYQAMFSLAWIRGVLHGVAGHATYTALTGVGFGVFRVLRRGSIRWLVPPALLTVAIAAHAVWNTFAGPIMASVGADALTQALVGAPLAVLVVSMPFLGTLVLTTWMAWRHEDDLIRQYLVREPSDVVHPDEVVRLVPARARTLRHSRALWTGGLLLWWRHRQLTDALVRLAFARWHHEGDALPWSPEEDAEVRRLRRRARQLRERGVRV